MKDVKEKAELYSDKVMNAYKIKRVKEFVESRLALWEPNVGESLEL